MTTFDQWAGIYDWVFAEKLDDIPFYLEEAVSSGGPVLELGSGTGRISIPVAQCGIEIVGLESSTEMLKVAEAKSAALEAGSRPTWVHGDMRDFSLGRKFALIIVPFRGFLSLVSVEEQRSCLSCVRDHLEPGGRLVFDIFVPDLDMLTDDGSTAFHHMDVLQPESGHNLVIWHQNRFDNHSQINNARSIIEEVDRDGEVIRKLYRDFQIRYIHRFEAQHLLELSGFRVEEMYGDFSRSPFDETSQEMVWVATPDL